MKVCLIHNLYPPFGRGGAEQIVAALAQALAARGDEVVVVTTKPVGARQAELKNKQPQNSLIKVYYLPSFYLNLGVWPKWLRFFWHLVDMFDLGGFWRLRRVLRRLHPDLVISNNLVGIGLLGAWAVRRQKIKHIHILHDIQLLHPSGLLLWGEEKKINTWPAKIYQVLARQLLASPDLVVSPSQWLVDLHKEKGFFSASQVKVVLNPVPSVNFLPVKQPKTNSHQASKLWRWLYVGQIEAHKGVAVLLRAFSQLSAEVKQKSELIIVGSGFELEKMQRLAKSYAQAGKHIYFLGQKDPQQVKRLMQASNYLIVPSLCYENSPTVIYEALSVGLPVIAFDLGGVSELLKRCVGCVLVQPASWRDLALSMEKVFYQNKNQFSALQTSALNFLTPDQYLDKIISFVI